MSQKSLLVLKPRQTVTNDDMRRPKDDVGDGVKTLSEATMETKAALYAALGIRMTLTLAKTHARRITIRFKAWQGDDLVIG
jgi:hypothetical protein